MNALYNASVYLHQTEGASANTQLIQRMGNHHSVNFLHGRATSAGAGRRATHATTRHAAFWHATTAAGSLVNLHHDWIDDSLEFLLFGFELILLRQLILVEPVQCVLHCLLDLLFVATLEFLLEFLLIECVAHCEAVVFQTVFRLDFLLVCFILGPEFLGFLNHAVDFSLGKTTFLIGDRDLIGFPCRLVLSRHIPH